VTTFPSSETPTKAPVILHKLVIPRDTIKYHGFSGIFYLVIYQNYTPNLFFFVHFHSFYVKHETTRISLSRGNARIITFATAVSATYSRTFFSGPNICFEGSANWSCCSTQPCPKRKMELTAECLDSFIVTKHNDKICQFSSNLENIKKEHIKFKWSSRILRTNCREASNSLQCTNIMEVFSPLSKVGVMIKCIFMEAFQNGYDDFHFTN
jgi:hypothetical protein